MKKFSRYVEGVGTAGDVLLAICTPAARHSDRIQEIHIKVIHTLVHAIEDGLEL